MQNQEDLSSSNPPSKLKTIDNLWTFWIAFLFIGPLALPLLWRNPRFNFKKKLSLTLLALAITSILLWVLGATSMKMLEDYQMIMEQLK